MNAQEWLDDLKTKACKALFIIEHPSVNDQSSPVDDRDIDASEMQAFFDAASPETINRLVDMIQIIADRAGEECNTCPFPKGIHPNLWDCCGIGMPCENAKRCEIQAAFQQTEPTQ